MSQFSFFQRRILIRDDSSLRALLAKPVLPLQSLPEHLVLQFAEILEEDVDLGEVNGSCVGEVVPDGGENLKVENEHLVYGSLADGEGGQMGEEIVPHEEAYENKVVYTSLKIKGKGKCV